MELPALHPIQREIALDPTRFRVAALGRRTGKSLMAAGLAVEATLRGQHVWWVAPSYKDSNVGWREIRSLLGQIAHRIPGFSFSETDRRITTPTGGWVEVRSADNPQSLRSEGLDFVVIDEAAFVDEAAWTEALRPALADRRGRALFISTPNGRNWFWRAWCRGLDPMEPEWKSWQAPSSSNPFLAPEEIDAMRRGMPEMTFRQEVLAEFLEDGAGVFRCIDECATAALLDGPVKLRHYVGGLDWARHEDFTVFTLIEVETHRVVAIDRFNQIDYAFQLKRIRTMYDRFRPVTIVAEQNAMGDPLIDQLQRQGLPIEPFVTTNATKKAAIEALSLAFERGEIAIPPDPVLLAELKSFEVERLPSGLMRYAAPSGLHDDTVMSLAMAWTAAAEPLFAVESVPLSRGAAVRF